MAIGQRRESATIYTFPPRGRSAAGDLVVKQMSAEEFSARRILPTDFGSGWYHDAAVESDRDEH